MRAVAIADNRKGTGGIGWAFDFGSRTTTAEPLSRLPLGFPGRPFTHLPFPFLRLMSSRDPRWRLLAKEVPLVSHGEKDFRRSTWELQLLDLEVVPRDGFEPPFAGSEPAVLPLDDRGEARLFSPPCSCPRPSPGLRNSCPAFLLALGAARTIPRRNPTRTRVAQTSQKPSPGDSTSCQSEGAGKVPPLRGRSLRDAGRAPGAAYRRLRRERGHPCVQRAWPASPSDCQQASPPRVLDAVFPVNLQGGCAALYRGGCQLLAALPIGSRGTRSSGIPR